MLTITAQRVAKVDQAIDIQVFITALQGSPGIQSVKVTAIDNSTLDKETPDGCPGHLSFFVKAVPLAGLPLYIEATECAAGVDQGQAVGVKTTVGPLFGEEIGLVECNPKGGNQNNQACIKLQSDIELRRNTILTQCGQASEIKGKRDAYAAAAAAALTAAIALTVAANAAPWPVNVILAIAAGIFWGIFIGFSVAALIFLNQLTALQDIMTQERADLAALISRLDDVCCPEFITVARDVPLCPN